MDRVFDPLLESNVTEKDSDDSDSEEEENLALVDGGKMSKSSRIAVKAVVNQKYVFPAFNILIYAENYIFPLASEPSTSKEEGKEPLLIEANRELIY